MKLSTSMTHRETLLGWSYLLVSMFVLPMVFELINSLLGHPLSEAVVNVLYFLVNFLCVAVIFRRFLLLSVKTALGKPWRCLGFAVLGLILYHLTMTLISQIIVRFYPEFSNVNDDAIMDMAEESYALIAFATIWLVPIAEETFYRGLFFQGLQRKNRLLAYCLSTLVFAGIHVIGYIGRYHWLTLLLCYIQYLPAGIVLAWAYEKTDTIVTPIFMHITINQIGMSAMR